MFCGKCGQEITGNVKFCPKCGNPVPVAAPAEEPAPATKTKKNKEKKKFSPLWFILIAVVVVVAAGVAFILLHFKATFTSADKLMKNALTDYVETAIDDNSSAYDQMSQLQDKDMVFDASLTVDKGLKSLLKQAGADADIDLDWIESTHLTVEVANDEDLSSSKLGLGINGTNVISMVYVLQASQNMAYMQVPELSNEYAAVDMSEYSEDEIQKIFSYYYNYYDAEREVLSSAEMKKLALKYTELAADQLDDVSKSKEDLEAGDITTSYYCLTANIDEKTDAEITVAVGEEMLQDKELKAALRVVYEGERAASSVDGYEDFDAWYDSQMDTIEDEVREAKKKLKKFEKDDESGEELGDITVYIDMSGKPHGIELNDTQNDEKIYYYMPEDGKEFGFDAGIDDGSTITRIYGTGINDHDVINGNFTIQDNDDEIMEVEVVDFDFGAYKKGRMLGEFVITPGSDADFGDDVLSKAFAAMSYDIVFDSTATETKCDITMESDGVEFCTINTSLVYDDVDGVAAPSNYCDLSSDDGVEKYYNSLSSQQLITNLKKADVPQKYINYLEMIFDYYLK